MARNRTRKTAIGLTTAEAMKNAINLYNSSGLSLRKVSERTGVPFATLFRYARKKKQNPLEQIRLTPKYNSRQIFDKDQEKELVQYILTMSKMGYGLTVTECRKLAYEMAIRNKIKIPENWSKNKEAGLEWFRGLKKRHSNISIRCPEGCSLSRMTSFNPHNVSTFFNKLEAVYSRSDNFSNGSRVYNLDETSTTTVQNPKKIIAGKGIKQVNKCTSGERGQNVTTCCIINALGTALPPVMVFPRKNFKTHMTNGAPPGTLGLATTSGWMCSEIFPQVIDHFIKFTLSSKENPTLLIMDNHESHISLAAIDKARDNGVTILTLPPHCSHRLQPLDVSVFASFKAHYNSAVDSWLLHHPGTPMTIYQVAECVGVAYDRSMTPTNIKSGFRKSGIFPLDKNVFSESDFMTSVVTDRPTLDQQAASTSGANESELIECNEDKQNQEPIQNQEPKQNQKHKQNQRDFVSPEQFRGYPKASERKGKINRRKGKCMIATDTPEKNIIEEKEQNKKKKPPVKAVENAKRKLVESSDEDDEVLSLHSETEDWIPEIDLNGFEDLERSPEVGDFVLTEFKINEKSKKPIYYIGQVLGSKDENGDLEVQFYRKHTKIPDKFVLPLVPDISTIAESAIKTILPKPNAHGKTKRQVDLLSFEIGFNNIDLR